MHRFEHTKNLQVDSTQQQKIRIIKIKKGSLEKNCYSNFLA